MIGLQASELTAYVIGFGTLSTGMAALITARSTSKKNAAEGGSIGETALANAVQVVEEVYDKVTGRMNTQIDELLEDNQKLREELKILKKLRAGENEA